VNARLDVTVLEEIADAQMSVKFITNPAELEPLKDRWESLNRLGNDHESPFFQSYAWCSHVAGIRLQRAPNRFRICVATLWRNDHLVGLWPLSLQKMSGAWIIKNLDDPFGQFAGVVFRNVSDIEPGVAMVVAALQSDRMADGMLIDAVVQSTPLHAALSGTGAHGTFVNEAIFVDMRPYASFEDYAETVNKKTRKNLRNALSRLRRSAKVDSTVVSVRAQVGEIISKSFAGRLEWMHEFGRSSPAFREAAFRDIVESLGASKDIDLLGFSLTADDHRIANQWGFSYLGRYYAYISARDSAYDEFSPGRLHLGMVIEACKLHGIDVIELMPPASPYKLTWTEHSKRLDRFAVTFTVKGYLALDLFADKLLPAMQALSRYVPAAIRKRLVGYLNLK
jgi:CelD/BcsL family acetyltransferase involved in cellulose biosynthesis